MPGRGWGMLMQHDKRKVFFFEKKKQKLLFLSPCRRSDTAGTARTSAGKKFFGSFFQKRTTLSFVLSEEFGRTLNDFR
jgi:hypothetical protein